MALPLVAIVGRPNVGKSTLFNRLTRSRTAVVHEESGVTRDRLVRPAEWTGVTFLVADTGGIVPFEEGTPFEAEITSIAREAIAAADAVVFVVDVHSGITSFDQAIARELRGLDKPVVLVVNKAEKDGDVYEAAAFHKLGLGDPVAISALHGRGTGDLLDVLVRDLPSRRQEPAADLRIALVGRPNVGKSSLLNALVGADRTLVSDVPGTTRDAIDTNLKWHGHTLTLVDTAGIRRRVKHHKGVEYFAMLRAVQAIQRCDVAVMLLDASSGIVAQDAKVAGEIHEAGRGAIVLWNKWDLVEKETMTYKRFEQEVRDHLPFLSYAPVLTISATERQRISKILELAWSIGETREKKIETSKVNDVLERAIARNPPKVHNRGTGKVYYATQTGTSPPRFTLFVNRVDFFPRHYIRYLNNQLREAFSFPGTRIHLELRPRS